jgi:hypothetical protein
MYYSGRGMAVSGRIYLLLSCLDTQTYDEVAPKIGYWFELALTQQLTTVDELVEYVSDVAWTIHHSPESFARFLQEFRDSSRRSAQARSFVDGLCTRVFQWFIAASAEDLKMDDARNRVAKKDEGRCFAESASVVGHLIKRSLLDHKLVRPYLVKSLTMHYYPHIETPAETVRANAICRLFAVAGSTLVQGVLEPEDVRVCFEILGARWSGPSGIEESPAAKLEVQCAAHPGVSHRTY